MTSHRNDRHVSTNNNNNNNNNNNTNNNNIIRQHGSHFSSSRWDSTESNVTLYYITLVTGLHLGRSLVCTLVMLLLLNLQKKTSESMRLLLIIVKSKSHYHWPFIPVGLSSCDVTAPCHAQTRLNSVRLAGYWCPRRD